MHAEPVPSAAGEWGEWGIGCECVLTLVAHLGWYPLQYGGGGTHDRWMPWTRRKVDSEGRQHGLMPRCRPHTYALGERDGVRINEQYETQAGAESGDIRSSPTQRETAAIISCELERAGSRPAGGGAAPAAGRHTALAHVTAAHARSDRCSAFIERENKGPRKTDRMTVKRCR